jgi:hypothetical protein
LQIQAFPFPSWEPQILFDLAGKKTGTPGADLTGRLDGLNLVSASPAHLNRNIQTLSLGGTIARGLPMAAERKKASMALKATLGCLTALASVTTLLFIGCNKLLEDMCGNEVLRSVPSPDGRVKAVIFERDCGATTGYSGQVSLLAATAALPNEGGDTFVADGDHGAAPGGPQVHVLWKDNQHLLIKHHPKRAFSTPSSACVPDKGCGIAER